MIDDLPYYEEFPQRFPSFYGLPIPTTFMEEPIDPEPFPIFQAGTHGVLVTHLVKASSTGAPNGHLFYPVNKIAPGDFDIDVGNPITPILQVGPAYVGEGDVVSVGLRDMYAYVYVFPIPGVFGDDDPVRIHFEPNGLAASATSYLFGVANLRSMGLVHQQQNNESVDTHIFPEPDPVANPGIWAFYGFPAADDYTATMNATNADIRHWSSDESDYLSGADPKTIWCERFGTTPELSPEFTYVGGVGPMRGIFMQFLGEPDLDYPQPQPPVTTPQFDIDPGMVNFGLDPELEPIDTLSIDVPLVDWTEREGEPHR